MYIDNLFVLSLYWWMSEFFFELCSLKIFISPPLSLSDYLPLSPIFLNSLSLSLHFSFAVFLFLSISFSSSVFQFGFENIFLLVKTFKDCDIEFSRVQTVRTKEEKEVLEHFAGVVSRVNLGI